MATRDMKVDDSLDDFAGRDVTFDGVTKKIYVAGQGPAVIGYQPSSRSLRSLGTRCRLHGLHAITVRP
jgi:hypothetical protein